MEKRTTYHVFLEVTAGYWPNERRYYPQPLVDAPDKETAAQAAIEYGKTFGPNARVTVKLVREW